MHTDGKHHNQKCDCNNGFHNLVHFADLFLDQTENNSDQYKQHGNRCGCGVCIGNVAVLQSLTDKGSCYHIGEGCDNKKCEQPAKQHKQLTSCFTDIFLNDHSHGLSFVLNRSVQRTEILNGSEEKTADDQP